MTDSNPTPENISCICWASPCSCSEDGVILSASYSHVNSPSDSDSGAYVSSASDTLFTPSDYDSDSDSAILDSDLGSAEIPPSSKPPKNQPSKTSPKKPGMSLAIPLNWQEELLTLHAKGWSPTKLKEYLGLQGVFVHLSAIKSLFAKQAAQRTAEAKAAYQARLLPGIFSDLDMLDAIRAREWLAYEQDQDQHSRQKTAQLLMKITELRAGFCGMNQKAAIGPTQDDKDQLLQKLLEFKANGPILDEPK